MTPSATPSEPPQERRERPVISFITLIVGLIATFCITRKVAGIIPALIATYLAYVYREDIGKEVGEMMHGRS